MNRSSTATWLWLWKGMKVAGLAGLIVFTWSSSILWIRYSDILYFKSTDLVTILFGAASLALFVFSIFIALLAIVGWQAFKDLVREQVSKAMEAKVENIENELRGRTLSVLGYSLGEMSVNPQSLEVEDEERLAEAIKLCEIGLSFLKKIKGPAEFMALNNYVYYNFLSRNNVKTLSLIEHARRLKSAGQEHNAIDLLLTGCGVILHYGTEESERKEARAVLGAIANSSLVPKKQKNEANYYLNLTSS